MNTLFKVILVLSFVFYGVENNAKNEFKHSSMDTSAHRYFPLNVGNRYFYMRSFNHNNTGIIICDITSITTIEGKTWYYLNQFPPPYTNNYYRYDSLSGNIFRYSGSFTCSFYYHQLQVDSLWASLNDDEKGCNQTPGSYPRCFADGTPVTLFGNYSTFRKSYGRSFPPQIADWAYAKNIGLYYYGGGSPANLTEYNLRGCLINGIAYGDTSNIVGAISISSEIPNQFSLSQNYPNPFNPTTKIRFDLSGKSVAQTFLSVYDVLGREITILVNEKLKPGTYEVDWSAANYPSGVYFYTLRTTGFTETKRMSMVK